MSNDVAFKQIINSLKGHIKCNTNMVCSNKVRFCDICKEPVKSFIDLPFQPELKTVCTACKIHVVNADERALFHRHLYNGLCKQKDFESRERECTTCCKTVEKTKQMTSHVLQKELAVCESCFEQLRKESPHFFTCCPFNKP